MIQATGYFVNLTIRSTTCVISTEPHHLYLSTWGVLHILLAYLRYLKEQLSLYQTQQYYSSLINWKKTGHISLRDSRSIYTCECHFNELHGHFYGKAHRSRKRDERRKERMLPPPLLLCWKYLFVPLFVPIIPPPDDQKEENIIKFQLLINVPSLA